jgi:hypothetical protein
MKMSTVYQRDNGWYFNAKSDNKAIGPYPDEELAVRSQRSFELQIKVMSMPGPDACG